MASCDMCGKSGFLLTANVEGTQMSVCKNCSKYGTVVKAPAKPKKKFSKPRAEKPEIVIVEGASQKIRKLRESHGLTQKEFAEKIGEKESIIPKIESGSMRLSIPVARKIEKTFPIKLTEEDTFAADYKKDKKSRATFTLGDFIKVKK